MSAEPGRRSGRPGARSSVVACLRALVYVRWRFHLRGLRGVGGRPWLAIGIAAGLGVAVTGQLLLLRGSAPVAGATTAPGDLLGTMLRFAPLGLPLLLTNGTRMSPLQLAVGDVSWLLTAPGGDRAILIRRLLARPVGYPLLLLVGGVIARLAAGAPVAGAWTAAAAAAIAVLTAGLCSCGAHLLTVGRARARRVLRSAALVWAGAIVASLAGLDFPGASWVALEPATGLLASALTDPGTASAAWLLATLGILLGATALLIATSSGFQEAAEHRARQAAHVQETLRRSRSGQELGHGRYRSGVPSLAARKLFSGERAVCYRALAQERRGLGDTMGLPLMAAMAMVGLLLLAPGYAWLPAILVVVHLISSSAIDGLAVELDHYHFRLAWFRPWPTLLWASVAPGARNTVIGALLWGLLLASPAVELRAWAVGAVMIPLASALLAAAGALAAARADSMAGRQAVVWGAAIAGAAPAVSALWPVLGANGGPLRVLLSALWVVVVTAGCLLGARHAVWPGRSPAALTATSGALAAGTGEQATTGARAPLR